MHRSFFDQPGVAPPPGYPLGSHREPKPPRHALLLTNDFESVMKNRNHFGFRKLGLDPGPEAGKQFLKNPEPDVSKTDMNHPRRRRRNQCPMEEVCILADHNPPLRPRTLPNLGIGRRNTQHPDMPDGDPRRQNERLRQVSSKSVQ